MLSTLGRRRHSAEHRQTPVQYCKRKYMHMYIAVHNSYVLSGTRERELGNRSRELLETGRDCAAAIIL